MLEFREPSKNCNFVATQSEKNLPKVVPKRQTQPSYSMADGASCEKNVRAVSIFIMLAPHQLAEHNEHVRSRHSVPKLHSCLGVGVENSGPKKAMRVENLEENMA